MEGQTIVLVAERMVMNCEGYRKRDARGHRLAGISGASDMDFVEHLSLDPFPISFLDPFKTRFLPDCFPRLHFRG
jgi:hypothetical protein